VEVWKIYLCGRYVCVKIYLCGRYICLTIFFKLSICIKHFVHFIYLFFNICIYIKALRYLKS
jgi:hypothetical protein